MSALAAWAFVKKALAVVPWWVWLAALAFLLAFLYGEARYKDGQADVQGRWDKATTDAEDAKRRFAGVTSTVSVGVQTQVIERTKTVKEKGDVIIKKVPVYIPVDTPDLPAGFRLLHDAAAGQTDPADSAAIASAAPVPVATASATIFGNYTACHAEYVKLEGWQKWWAGVKAACESNSSCQLLESPDAVLP